MTVVTRFAGPHGKMPVIAYLPKTLGSMRARILKFVGGPNMNVGDFGDAFDQAMVKRAATGYGTIIPAYIGTFHRSVHPKIGFPYAADELSAYHDFLASRQHAVPLVLRAESGGAILLMSLTNVNSKTPIILINPVLRTAEYSLGRIMSRPRSSWLIGTYNTVWVLNEDDINNSRPILKQVNIVDLFTRFFGATLSFDVGQALVGKQPSCVTIIYGTLDDRIGTEVLPRLIKEIPSLRVSPISGLGHFAENMRQVSQAETAFDRALIRAC